MKKLEEYEIYTQLEARRNSKQSNDEPIVSTFKACQNTDGKWVIEFTYLGKNKGTLICKHRKNIREFSRLYGVQQWMQKMKIAEFTVLLNLSGSHEVKIEKGQKAYDDEIFEFFKPASK